MAPNERGENKKNYAKKKNFLLAQGSFLLSHRKK